MTIDFFKIEYDKFIHQIHVNVVPLRLRRGHLIWPRAERSDASGQINNEDIARWRQKNDTAAIMIDHAATLLDSALHAFYASRATPPCPRFDVVYFEADMDGVVRGIVIDAETDGEYKMRDIVDLRDKETFARHIDLIAGAMNDMLDAHGLTKLVRIDVDSDMHRITVSII